MNDVIKAKKEIRHEGLFAFRFEFEFETLTFLLAFILAGGAPQNLCIILYPFA